MVVSLSVQAEFQLKGSGIISYPTGVVNLLPIGFSITKGSNGFTFVAGEQEMQVSSVPEKYSIWLSINKEHQIFVQEFSRSYFNEFEWQLGNHSIALKKKVLSPKRYLGDYVLSIDNIDYFFKSKQSFIDILFNEDGISSIEANGFLKDLWLSE